MGESIAVHDESTTSIQIDRSRCNHFTTATECFARSTAYERQLFEQEDVLLQFARRIPGLYQDTSCHGRPVDSQYFGLDPMTEYHNNHILTNTAIGEKDQPIETVSRRFSMGLSGLSAHNVTTSIFDLKDCIANDNKLYSMRDASSENCFAYQGTDKISAFDFKTTTHSPMKVSRSFFHEVTMPAVRRSSIDSVESFATESLCDDEEVMQDDDEDDDDVEEEEEFSDYLDNEPLLVGNSNLAPATETVFDAFLNHASHHYVNFQNNPSALPVIPLLQSSPLEVKEAIDSFTDSMTKSMRSQQAIHDWDRKMGLKRSHSKTMRLSMRSRKRVKLLLKKEFGIVLSLPRK
jgi:hypothetical protein